MENISVNIVRSNVTKAILWQSNESSLLKGMPLCNKKVPFHIDEFKSAYFRHNHIFNYVIQPPKHHLFYRNIEVLST